MIYRLFVIGVFLVLTACGGLPVDGTSTPVEQPVEYEPQPALEPEPVLEPEPEPALPQSADPGMTDEAIDQLLSESMQLREQGDVEGAISVAERALRIAPRNPRVYYVLGTLYLDKGEADEALQLAHKAGTLDTENFYRRSIDRLIAECEAAQAYR